MLFRSLTTISSGARPQSTWKRRSTSKSPILPQNNAESVSELAIVAVLTTSTPVHTSTSNTQADEIAANTEVNDETDDKAQGEEEDGQSEIMQPQPPYVGQRFGSFEDAKEYYQRCTLFHGFVVNTEYHRKIKRVQQR